MKTLLRVLFLVIAADSVCLGQDWWQLNDTIVVNSGGSSRMSAGALQATVQTVSITGNISALVVPVGFSDKPETQAFPVLVNSDAFPVLGVNQNGILLKDLITANGGSLPEDQWWGPAFNHYFTTESGGLYNVNFQFIKKSDGTRYQTIHPFSYFGNVFSGLQGIINEVGQNMYADDSTVFNNVHHISFTFEGLSKCDFYDCGAAGFTPGIYTVYSASSQPLWTGPITCQLGCKDIPHEFMHSIGATVGQPGGFYGLPDRGYEPDVYDPDLNDPGHTGNSFHGNMQFDYDIMEHNVALLPQHSLYGLRPIASHDLIFLGWIKPDEILPVDQGNFANYADIKLADVNYPLTAQQKADGYYRVVKVMAHQNYDNRGYDDYYLVEYHNASEFDKAFENYDEYQAGGYNTGVLIWHVKEVVSAIGLHSDNLAELQPAVPYNSWYGNPLPPGDYPAHGNFNRPPLTQYGQNWWNGVYSGDFNYLDDSSYYPSSGSGSKLIYFPDGGTHEWEFTAGQQYSAWQEGGSVAFPRMQSMKSDFFSDSNVKGHVTNAITDGTRPSTKEWGYYNSQTGQPVSNPTHIAITNITRHSGYMTVRVYYNAYAGTITSNTTISGNAYVAGSMTVNPGVTLTIASGSKLTVLDGSTLTVSSSGTLSFGTGASLAVNGTLTANGASFTSASGSWSGIIFNGSSTGNLQNCTISYANSPIIIDTTNVTISGCTLNNSDFNSGNSNTAAAIQVWSSSPTIINTHIVGGPHSWSGVRFCAGSGGAIRGCTIEGLGGGHGIILQGGSSTTVSTNTIRNNRWHGVICYQNLPAWPAISSNTTTGNADGFAIYNSYGVLRGNTASQNACGIYLQDGSAINSGSTNEKGANVITNNTYGIYAANRSQIVFGGWSGRYYMGTCNSIYGNNTWDVISNGSSGISAEYDWWGQYPPNTSKFNVDGTSYFYYTPALDAPEDCPLGPIILAAPKTASPNEAVLPPIAGSGTAQGSPDSLFAFAQGAQMDGDYKIAAAVYRSLLRDTISVRDKDRALVSLFNVFAASHDSTIIADLDSISRSSDALGQRSKVMLGYAYEATHQMARAQAVLNDVIAKYPGTESERQALIHLASMRYYDPSTDKVSSAALAQLVAKYGSTLDEGELIALGCGGETVQKASMSAAKVQKEVESDSTSAFSSELLGNYPNPFNPTTLIKYSIAKDTRVTLKVYDVVGRVVATLVDGVQSAGRHEVTFDGSKLASGVYFYRLTTPTYSKVMKMLMVK